MKQNEALIAIIQETVAGRLGVAVNRLENYLLTYPQLASDMEKLQAIKADFELLLHYWQQGVADPERENLYRQLSRRLYHLTSNMLLIDHLRSSRYMMTVYSRPRQSKREWSVAAIRSRLEDFVSTQAMLGLEPEHVRRPKERQLQEEHARMMDDLFDYIVTSRLWSETSADSFRQLLLSPTVDSLDRQLIVSAISLSVMQAFDIHKFSVLCDVYENTDDEAIRQRALVGWVLGLDATVLPLYPEVADRVADLCQDERALQELTELQMQLYYCMEAEDDGRKIQQEIIPDIIKGNNLRITRSGLEEFDEDSLDEILHPDAAEQSMEQMEQSMHRMVDMQKNGADIYFGGFSQMKRFPFFNNLGAWFVPFYPQHPAISTIWNETKGKRFLETITRLSAFCDSDKYSFVLAFNQVLDRLPQQMLSLVEQGEASPVPLGGQVDLEEQRQPAFQRRLYLQNLYRFYRLFAARNEFLDPFADPARFLFFANPVFRKTRLQEHSMEVASFLMKRRRTSDLLRVLDSYEPARHDYQYYMLRARFADTPEEQCRLYQKALDAHPDSEQALAGWARSNFDARAYEDAIVAYRRLTERQPDRLSYQLSLAACLANADHTAEAEPLLFKLQYLHPDNDNVIRILAWTLMAEGKYDQAERYYLQLHPDDTPRQDDKVNYAFCLWLKGQPSRAIEVFSSLQKGAAAESITSERRFLLSHGLNDIDLQLMFDSF